MSRWRASFIHLLISAAIALVFLGLTFLLWYPPPYFRVSGADHLLVILIGVDVVLGPLLTLIVFRSGKPSLKFDLTVIGCLQAAALAYGAFVVLSARPVWSVYAVDRFIAVPANALQIESRKRAVPPFDAASWTGPRLVAAVVPEDPQKREAILFSALAGADIETMPEYFVDYGTKAKDALDRASPLVSLSAQSEAAAKAIDDFVETHGGSAETWVFLPLVGQGADATMVLDPETGHPVDALPIDPWVVTAPTSAND